MTTIFSTQKHSIDEASLNPASPLVHKGDDESKRFLKLTKRKFKGRSTTLSPKKLVSLTKGLSRLQKNAFCNHFFDNHKVAVERGYLLNVLPLSQLLRNYYQDSKKPGHGDKRYAGLCYLADVYHRLSQPIQDKQIRQYLIETQLSNLLLVSPCGYINLPWEYEEVAYKWTLIVYHLQFSQLIKRTNPFPTSAFRRLMKLYFMESNILLSITISALSEAANRNGLITWSKPNKTQKPDQLIEKGLFMQILHRRISDHTRLVNAADKYRSITQVQKLIPSLCTCVKNACFELGIFKFNQNGYLVVNNGFAVWLDGPSKSIPFSLVPFNKRLGVMNQQPTVTVIRRRNHGSKLSNTEFILNQKFCGWLVRLFNFRASLKLKQDLEGKVNKLPIRKMFAYTFQHLNVIQRCLVLGALKGETFFLQEPLKNSHGCLGWANNPEHDLNLCFFMYKQNPNRVNHTKQEVQKILAHLNKLEEIKQSVKESVLDSSISYKTTEALLITEWSKERLSLYQIACLLLLKLGKPASIVLYYPEKQ